MDMIKGKNFDVNFDNNYLISKISTSWMETDFIPAINVEEDLKIYMDDQIIEQSEISSQNIKIMVEKNNCIVSRDVKEHKIFPAPEVILKVKNNDNKKHHIKFEWSIKSMDNYAIIQENLSKIYTNYKQNYLFFLKIPSFLARDETNRTKFTLETTLDPMQ
ncbi:MAG: hypothetical protein ACTSPY_13535, partial [Candidatus Helarchaeota archaeon]